MKFAVACLIGSAAAFDNTYKIWELRSVQEHRDDSDTQIGYGATSTGAANDKAATASYRSSFMQEASGSSSSSSDDEMVGIHGDYYMPWEHHKKPENGEYSRVTTPHFSADSDDIFMRSMIETYALEEKNCDEDKDGKKINCTPSGKYWMDEAATRAAASEVLNTHMKLSGAALTNYLNTYFAKAWGHFDVNKGGHVEVIKMPQFMRFLASDQSLSLGESG